MWLKIDQLHLNYLKAEGSAKKLEIRRKLTGFVHQYLCLVPQDRKFCNSSTSELIYESAKWTPGFSALSASSAFEALETYAANLINQPWRKEFREVKQFGGFYKHTVESSLYCAERVFLQMGYRPSGHDSLILEGAVDQDKATTVARDCILAHVECQIVVSIMQGVSAQHPCTWEEVLDFRRDHIGSPEQAVRSMVYLKNQMQYRQQQQQQLNPNLTPGSANGGYLCNNSNGPSVGKLIDVPDFGAPQIPLTIKHLEEESKSKSPNDYNINQSNAQQTPPDVSSLLSRMSPSELEMLQRLKIKEQQQQQQQQFQSSSYYEVDGGGQDETDAVHRRLRQGHHNPDHHKSHHRKNDSQKRNSANLERKSLRHSRPLEPPKSEIHAAAANVLHSWQCYACTFANDGKVDICEMCGKSRNSPDLR